TLFPSQCERPNISIVAQRATDAPHDQADAMGAPPLPGIDEILIPSGDLLTGEPYDAFIPIQSFPILWAGNPTHLFEKLFGKLITAQRVSDVVEAHIVDARHSLEPFEQLGDVRRAIGVQQGDRPGEHRLTSLNFLRVSVALKSLL